MSVSSPSIDDRVARLERRIRNLFILLLAIPALAFLLGAAANDVLKAKSVTTQKLVIVDPKGRDCAAFYVSKKGEPVFEMYNQDHSLLLNVGKSDDNGFGFIQFFDNEGKFKGGVGGNALE
jgi:hypothetical protein